eukprot:4576368-Pleurochrysis_carterae.AAC.1
MIPKADGGSALDECYSRELHNGADCPFSDAVELVDVRRTCRRVHPVFGQKVGEFARKEFTRIVAVQGSDDACGSLGVFVCQSGEGGEELANVGRRPRFVSHEVYGFKTGVVVH